MIPSVKARLIAKKIKPQFPDTPEGLFMFSIVECALSDAGRKYKKKDKSGRADQKSAFIYLASDMPHCEICGVSSAWVRSIMNKLNFIPFEYRNDLSDEVKNPLIFRPRGLV